MDWIKHPAYARAGDRVVERFRARVYAFKHLRPVVFLCGGALSARRDTVADYLRRRHADVFVFYAEGVWEHITELEDINALEMESQLARLADLLIIVVESPGTFAEIGAFAASEELRRKLLPILDKRFQNDESFINTGPVRWVDKDSRYGPTIYSDFEVLLAAIRELEERLQRLPSLGRPRREDIADIARRPKHLLFLLADLLAVVGPATADQCTRFVRDILNSKPVWSVTSLLGLATALGLVKVCEVDGKRYYYRVMINGELESFQARRRFDLPTERARFLSVVQTLPGGIEVLRALSA